jgi:hypothetical protein
VIPEHYYLHESDAKGKQMQIIPISKMTIIINLFYYDYSKNNKEIWI